MIVCWSYFIKFLPNGSFIQIVAFIHFVVRCHVPVSYIPVPIIIFNFLWCQLRSYVTYMTYSVPVCAPVCPPEDTQTDGNCYTAISSEAGSGASWRHRGGMGESGPGGRRAALHAAPTAPPHRGQHLRPRAPPAWGGDGRGGDGASGVRQRTERGTEGGGRVTYASR